MTGEQRIPDISSMKTVTRGIYWLSDPLPKHCFRQPGGQGKTFLRTFAIHLLAGCMYGMHAHAAQQPLKITKEQQKQAEATEYYTRLGLKPRDRDNISPEQVKEAFRKASLLWHPDRWPNADVKQKLWLSEIFTGLNRAHEVLMDEEKAMPGRRKKDYDRYLTALTRAGRPLEEASQDEFHNFGKTRNLNSERKKAPPPPPPPSRLDPYTATLNTILRNRQYGYRDKEGRSFVKEVVEETKNAIFFISSLKAQPEPNRVALPDSMLNSRHIYLRLLQQDMQARDWAGLPILHDVIRTEQMAVLESLLELENMVFEYACNEGYLSKKRKQKPWLLLDGHLELLVDGEDTSAFRLLLKKMEKDKSPANKSRYKKCLPAFLDRGPHRLDIKYGVEKKLLHSRFLQKKEAPRKIGAMSPGEYDNWYSISNIEAIGENNYNDAKKRWPLPGNAPSLLHEAYKKDSGDCLFYFATQLIKMKQGYDPLSSLFDEERRIAQQALNRVYQRTENKWGKETTITETLLLKALREKHAEAIDGLIAIELFTLIQAVKTGYVGERVVTPWLLLDVHVENEEVHEKNSMGSSPMIFLLKDRKYYKNRHGKATWARWAQFFIDRGVPSWIIEYIQREEVDTEYELTLPESSYAADGKGKERMIARALGQMHPYHAALYRACHEGLGLEDTKESNLEILRKMKPYGNPRPNDLVLPPAPRKLPDADNLKKADTPASFRLTITTASPTYHPAVYIVLALAWAITIGAIAGTIYGIVRLIRTWKASAKRTAEVESRQLPREE